jgi:glycosyltransferase involved in cell wall biosynthesis
MNVLYLTNNANRASTTVPTEGWFRLLRPRGLRPVLVSDRPGAFHAWAVESGIDAYHVPLPFPSKTRPWPFFRSLGRLWGLVRKHRIQLIHCNEQEIYPIGQYLGRLCRLPVAVSVHFTMAPRYSEWIFGGARCPRRIFFISRGNLEACRAGIDGIIPEANRRLLYNGLDLEKFRPDAARRESFREGHAIGPGPVIGVACALRPRKQLEHLFEAASRLASPGLRVALAGGPVPGDEDYSAGLLEMGRRLLGDRLLYLGHLDELRDLYNGLDLFVNTSQEEACSISVLEAMACGCPVVGYPSRSVDEQVLPEGGEIVDQDDVDALAGALSRWVDDLQRLASSREGARRQVEANFDIRRISEQLWGYYSEIVA